MKALPFQTEIATKAEMPGVGTIRVKGIVTYHDAPALRELILKPVAPPHD